MAEVRVSVTPYPRDATIHGLFEEQAARVPDAVALQQGSESMTYAELDARAGQLARHLQGLGVGPDTLVAIHVERSFEMIVGILGILKAGGAYVPLDPGYPMERLAFMLDDTRAPLLLTQERLADSLPATWAHVICLDSDWDEVAGRAGANVPSAATASSLAYVMYTSGSTGKPKGVEVPHRGVVRLVRGGGYASLGADEVFLQLAPLSFDASTFEIWSPLCNGGRLAIFPPGTASLEDLGAALARYGVTTLWLTAGLFHLMVDERLEDLRPLRQLLAGGDVLSVPRVRRFLHELPGCRLINGYGPTESTTFAACHTVREIAEDAPSIPIGRPLAGTEVVVLDAQGSVVGDGAAGELCIGGDGLARGYWNRPELTKERFIPHPSVGGGARLYRTGDLGRYLPDGTIEFLGRMDHQVKVRGFRVELEEIEAALTRHPEVQESIVLAKETGAAGKRLTAFLRMRPDASCSDAEIRQFLSTTLPDYMLPAELVRLLSFPLTPNGKVDRAALPSCVRVLRETPAAPPDSSLERDIAAVWEAVLEVTPVGREENFFDLGGDSLLVVEVHTKLRKRLGAELSITDLFEYPTVKALAARLRAHGPESGVAREAVERGRRQREAMMGRTGARAEMTRG